MKNKICTDNLPQIMSSLEFLFIHEQPVKFLFMNYSDLLVNFSEKFSYTAATPNSSLRIFLCFGGFLLFPSCKVLCCTREVERKKEKDRCSIICSLALNAAYLRTLQPSQKNMGY